MDLATMRYLHICGALGDVVAVPDIGGWSIDLPQHHQMLTSTRGHVRTFRSLDTLARQMRLAGIEAITVRTMGGEKK